MKSNTKSSITLPAKEVAMIAALMKKIGAKSKVEVVRKGLELLREQVEGELLRERFRAASAAVRRSNASELAALEGTILDGLADED